jgi:hypothetical protein
MAGFVTVGCKIPNGVILQLQKLEDYDVPVMGGGVKTEKRSVRIGSPVVLRGPGRAIGQEPSVPIIGGKWPGYGYALNHNIDADFWAAWCEQNKDSDLLQHHMLIAQPKVGGTEAEAREKVGLRSGLEPINTTEPLPGSQARRGGVKIERAPESAKPIPAAA